MGNAAVNRSRRASLAAAVGLSAALAAHPARADEATAQRAYAEALEAARSGDLRAARTSFERAYRESPHHLVLLNLARVCRDLGELEDARRYLERYLAEGNARISPPEQAAAEREIASIDTELARRPLKTTADAAAAPAPPAAEHAAPVPPAAAPPSPPRARAPSAPPPSRKDEVRRARWSGFSLAFASTGLALAGVGTAVLVSNRARYDAWEEEDQALDQLGAITVVPGDGGSSLAAAREQQQRIDQNNALADSIDDSDRVAWVAVTSGIVMVATATVLWLTEGDGPRIVAGARRAELRFSF
ncbi:MAG TPA: tetratricopeptide repeat protein [Polyangiaceae bacterium]